MRVLLFVKYPEPGKVKTRLAARIGSEHAAGLYGAFVQDELHMLRELGAAVTICYAPEFPEHEYAKWLPGLELQPQRGKDLGERMLHALRESLNKDDYVLLIGSDLPDLPFSLLCQAREALHSAPLCFGAAADGGFYLVAATRSGLHSNLFRNVVWSTEHVLQTTLNNCEALRIPVSKLPLWPDTDTLEDLQALHVRSTLAPHTRAYIRTHGLETFWNN